MGIINKKGQITIFLILAIVILIFGSTFFYFRSQSVKENTDVDKTFQTPLDITPIRNYVDSCIKSVGKDAIIFVGKRGGYFELPRRYTIDYYNDRIPYYFYENRDLMPSLHKIEEEISKYVSSYLSFCLNNFSSFNQRGFEINKGNIKINTIIQKNSIVFNADLHLTISKDNTIREMDKFIVKIDNVRLMPIYDLSKNFIMLQLKNSDSVCLSCLFNLAIKNNVSISMESLENSSIAYTIHDNNTLVNNKPYTYVFANKYVEYSCSNLPLDADISFIQNCINVKIDKTGYTFHLDEIPDIKTKVNQDFNYKAKASGADLKFKDYSPLFDINEKTGEINFKPIEKQIGNHTVLISVVDKLGNQDYKMFKLVIEN